MRIVKPISITDSVLTSSSVPENDHPAYSSTTGYELKSKVIIQSAHKIYECVKQEIGTVTFSSSGTAVVTWNNHGLTNGRMVKFSSTGAVPTGITVNTVYYVINATTNTFNISATSGGSAISTSNAGSGTITATTLVNNINPSANPEYWLDSGSTNKYKAFDGIVQSQTTATSSLSFTVVLGTYIDTMVFLNLTGAAINIKMTSTAYGVVYEEAIDLLTDEEDVVDLWTYLFSGFRERKDVIIDNLPPYSDVAIEVTITGSTGSTVGIGAAIFGLAKDISSTKLGVEQGAKVSITDYSVKTRDNFGNYIITERAFSKRANFTIYINNSELDGIQNFLAECRAIPAVYIGSAKYASATIYGYYKSFEIDIAYPDYSVCQIELDGLT